MIMANNFHKLLCKLGWIELHRENMLAANSTYLKGGVSYFAETFVQAESLVPRTNFYAKKSALRVAANRHASPI